MPTALEVEAEIRRTMSEKGTTLMEAMVMYCEARNVEPESLASLVSKLGGLKSELYGEAEELNLVKRTNRLPR